MGYSMYICPDCQKVFKVQGNNKKVKCSNCSALLKDSEVSMEEWTILSPKAKANIKQSVCTTSTDNDTPIEYHEESSKPIQAKSQTITCPQCSTEISKNSKFCSECGYNFGAFSTPTVTPIATPVVTSPSQPQKSRSLFDGYEDKIASSPISNSTKPSANLMKCPSCGADIENNSRQCSYCGASITYSMRREQEQVNKDGCPKCGSSNVQFKRENHGEIQGKNSKRVIHKTVGFCKDCGYTWYPSTINQPQKSDNMVWWVLGWIFFFPAPLMVLIWRKKNTWDTKIKIAVTVAFWIVFFAIGSINNSTEDTASQNNIEQTETKSDTEHNEETVAKSDTKPETQPAGTKHAETKPKTNETTVKEKSLTTEETKYEENISYSKYSSYDDIYKEYKQKIIAATPALVEEYKREAASNSDGLEGLATICNNKVSELAEINNEGVSEMADFMLKNGSGNYSEYEDWAGKLMDVYMEEAQKIQDAYIDSAM